MAETPKAVERPLSPHLQIYRPQITSMLSITHRATGAGLAFGAVFVTWWLLSVVNGVDSYKTFHHFATGFIGRIMMFGWLWAVIYHFLNGIRHLVWDTGRGLTIESATKSGWAIVGASIVLTLVIWAVA